MRKRWVRRGMLLGGCVAGAAMAWGQANGAAQKQNPPTFQVTTRVVLTDVTVTDKDGNPVKGLKQQDFRIFDNGRPEALKSFEEHRGKSSAAFEAPTQPSGIYSNAAMLHPPAVVNVILIDSTTIDLIDQMYLYQQLTKFIEKLPPGEPVAIFSRKGQMTLLLQGFTADHAALLSAIRKAIPHFQHPDAQFATDYDTLQQIAYYLAQVPGRKNLLWFSGGSKLFLQVDPTSSTGGGLTGAATGQQGVAPVGLDLPANMPDYRQIYDVLEQERITLYPIDARGLVTYGSQAMIGQHLQMSQDAEATGGQAWYNTNGLAHAAERVLETDGDYYTLTYSPDDLHNNGRWHRVEVQLSERGCRLSYRRGYFDDEKNGTSPTEKNRALLRAKGTTKQELDEQGAPIAFTAQVVEVSPLAQAAAVRDGDIKAPKPGEVPYAIVYEVPAGDLTAKSVGQDDRGTYAVGSGVLVFDHYGTLVKRHGQTLTMTADEREIRAKPDGKMKFDEEVDLPNGEDYLYLVVWDATTGRLGMLNITLNVKKPGKAAKP